jgi:hypothetical protein
MVKVEPLHMIAASGDENSVNISETVIDNTTFNSRGNDSFWDDEE